MGAVRSSAESRCNELSNFTTMNTHFMPSGGSDFFYRKRFVPFVFHRWPASGTNILNLEDVGFDKRDLYLVPVANSCFVFLEASTEPMPTITRRNKKQIIRLCGGKHTRDTGFSRTRDGARG